MPRACAAAMLLSVGLGCVGAPPARAAPGPPVLIPPVDGAIARPFEAPASDYGAGHRGTDYAVARGAPVRAAAAGTVSFAGPVAGTRAVTVEHSGGLATTYTVMDEVWVERGDPVPQGHWIGTASTSHLGGAPGLHFGVKLHGRYVDPQRYLGAVDVTRAVHLAPLVESYAGRVPTSVASDMRHRALRPCVDPAALDAAPPPPNRNVAVAVPGIASETARGLVPEIYRDLAEGGLGYPPQRVYAFSYRGVDGARFHESYERTDTFGDLRGAARRLGDLLERIGRAHPGRDVDLVAHSQGGVIARLVLQRLARAWDPGLPRVAHLVTLATPHRGSAAARLPAAVERSLLGRLSLGALSLAARWLAIPRSDSVALSQMRDDSPLIGALARQDVVYGTQVLSLAMPHDLLVTADSAAAAHETSRVLGPEGLWGHSSILRSQTARALAYNFLRDGASSCTGAWDRAGPWVGRVLDGLYRGISTLLGGAG